MLGLLLLADSRLPSGGHGHSGGVEALVDRGLLRSEADLAAFLAGRLRDRRGRARRGCGRRVRAGGAGMSAGDAPDTERREGHPAGTATDWAAWDHAVSARLPAAATRAASYAQGAALLRTAARAWPSPAVDALRALPRAHHPLVLGVAAAAAGADAVRRRRRSPCTTSSAGPCTAAVRLLGLDPLRVAAVAAEAGRRAEPVVADAAAARRGGRRGGRPGPAARRRQPAVRRAGPAPPIDGGDPLCIVTTSDRQRSRRWRRARRALRIGIGGPVGGGKTALVAALCRALRDQLSMAVVTNDIYTEEDADFLRRHGVLPDERIRAVRTGCCPHTAIRDDITANLDAVEELVARHDPDLVLVESGGDNLTATFSYGLVHAQIFVLDVAGGDKVPRKGGPGVTRSDLLVINKIDLAPLVGADLDVMRTRRREGARGQADGAGVAARAAGRGAHRGVGHRAGRGAPHVSPEQGRARRDRAAARRAARPGRQRMRWSQAWPVVLRPTGDEQVHLVHGAGGRSAATPRAESTWPPARRCGCAARERRSCSRAPTAGPAAGTVRAEVGAGGAPGLGARADGGLRRRRAGGRLRVRLAAGAGAVLREIVVLGRHGERGGRYRGELTGRRRRAPAARPPHPAGRGRPGAVRPGRHRRGPGGRHARAGRRGGG